MVTLPDRFAVEVRRLAYPRQPDKTLVILVNGDVFAETQRISSPFTTRNSGLCRHVVNPQHGFVETADVHVEVLTAWRQGGEGCIRFWRAENLIPTARVLMPAQQAVVALVPVSVLQAEIGETEQDVRPRPHEGSLQGQLVCKPLVVGVVERDKRVARFG